jgi:hypothetical protein
MNVQTVPYLQMPETGAKRTFPAKVTAYRKHAEWCGVG